MTQTTLFYIEKMENDYNNPLDYLKTLEDRNNYFYDLVKDEIQLNGKFKHLLRVIDDLCGQVSLFFYNKITIWLKPKLSNGGDYALAKLIKQNLSIREIIIFLIKRFESEIKNLLNNKSKDYINNFGVYYYDDSLINDDCDDYGHLFCEENLKKIIKNDNKIFKQHLRKLFEDFELNFDDFDEICDKYGLDKIKVLGYDPLNLKTKTDKNGQIMLDFE